MNKDPKRTPLKRFEDFLGKLLTVSKQEVDEALEAEKRVLEPKAEEQATE